MSLRSIYDILARHLKDVFKTSSKTFWRPFEDIFVRRIEDILKMYDKGKYIRPDQDVFKASGRRFLKTYQQANIFALLKTSWRRFKDVFWRRRRKASSKRLQDVFNKRNVCWDLKDWAVSLWILNVIISYSIITYYIINYL